MDVDGGYPRDSYQWRGQEIERLKAQITALEALVGWLADAADHARRDLCGCDTCDACRVLTGAIAEARAAVKGGAG